MIEYVILGTSHLVQECDELEGIIISSTARHGIALVAEENPYNIASTSAWRGAKRQGVAYLQVDPSWTEWGGLGIYREMASREHPCLQGRDIRLSHADDVREQIWLEKIGASLDRGRVLVVCGYLHVDFLAQKVEERGGTVLEKTTFPAELLDRKPDVVLSPAELEDFASKRREA